MLKEEIDQAQRLVKTDAYQMSIGEIINMYNDNEFIINPDFQRLFRWEIGRKSKLIESLLLGIPIPSIFVFEREDSKWELIDGLQRISTLLEFMGKLKDPNTGTYKAPSALVATKYLPSLDKSVWELSDLITDVPVDEQNPLEGPQQLAIKRSRLSVEILKRPSDNETKYDLFQRLNAGGVEANAQELRNCIIVMVNNQYANFIKLLAETDPFNKVIGTSEEQKEKQKHMEYATRFLVHTYVDYDGKLDVEEFIDEGIASLAAINETQEANVTFNATFTYLHQAFGENALRRIDHGNFTGRVGLAAFESIAVGIAKNISNVQGKADPVDFVRQRIEAYWQSPEIQNFYTSGLRGTTRLHRTISFGEKWFAV